MIAALVSLAISGCSGEAAEKSKYAIPEGIRYNYVWSASDGVELTSPEVVVARAFFESWDISMQVGTSAAYPGYEAKLSSLIRSPDNTLPASLFYYDSPKRVVSAYGTYYWRVMEVERKGEVRRITACSWDNALSYPKDDRYTTSDGAASLITRADWIELRVPTNAGAQQTSVGEGPARYPSTDVFGAWSFNAVGRADQQFVDRCSALPDNPVPADLRPTTPRTLDQPLPALPPIPGWPR
ncbi:hypothetical protein [Nocardia sp. NPDC004722]